MYYRRQYYPVVWEDLNRLETELSHFLNDRRIKATRMQDLPAVNVWVGEDNIMVSTEIPGVEVEDVDITVVGETLTIQGERKPLVIADNAKFHRQERGYGKFSRTIQLPFPVQSDKVNASLDKGVLEITLPRAEEDKPRKISVKS